jgi:hypothetical protein
VAQPELPRQVDVLVEQQLALQLQQHKQPEAVVGGRGPRRISISIIIIIKHSLNTCRHPPLDYIRIHRLPPTPIIHVSVSIITNTIL